jgi:hypothetical protein
MRGFLIVDGTMSEHLPWRTAFSLAGERPPPNYAAYQENQPDEGSACSECEDGKEGYDLALDPRYSEQRPRSDCAGLKTKSAVPPEIPLTIVSIVSDAAGVRMMRFGEYPAARKVVMHLRIETRMLSVLGAWFPLPAIAARTSSSRPS